MIGSDIPGDSCVRDQNTNGPLSQRWQLVVGVYNLAVISTNLMNQITVIHPSLSPSLMAYAVCSALKLKGMKGDGRTEKSYFWADGKTERKKKSIIPLLLGSRVRHRDSISRTSFIAHSDANLSVQRLSSMVKTGPCHQGLFLYFKIKTRNCWNS